MKSVVVTSLRSIPTSHNQHSTSANKRNNLYSSKIGVKQCLWITWDSNQRIQCTTYLRSENPSYIVVFHNVPRRKILCVFKKWLISAITNYRLQGTTLQLMMDYAQQKKNQTMKETSQLKFKKKTNYGRLPYSMHWKSLQCSQGLEAKVTTLETVQTCCGTSTWLS